MHFYVFEECGYAFLQDRPIVGWTPALVFDAPTGRAAIDTVNQRVAVRQGAELYAPPPVITRLSKWEHGGWREVEETEEQPGAFRCPDCHEPIKPSRVDPKNRRVAWRLDRVCAAVSNAA